MCSKSTQIPAYSSYNSMSYIQPKIKTSKLKTMFIVSDSVGSDFVNHRVDNVAIQTCPIVVKQVLDNLTSESNRSTRSSDKVGQVGETLAKEGTLTGLTDQTNEQL